MTQRLHESQEKEAKASEEAEATKERLQEVEQSLQQQIAGDTAMIEQLRGDVERLETHCGELEAQINHLVTEADAVRRDAVLERLKALETERQKWEAREERLVEQLREAQRKSHLDSKAHVELRPRREATPAQDDLSGNHAHSRTLSPRKRDSSPDTKFFAHALRPCRKKKVWTHSLVKLGRNHMSASACCRTNFFIFLFFFL